LEGDKDIAALRRTHGCGTLNTGHVGQDVALAGWVQRRRDHGGVIFLDLRDRSGVVQTVLSPDRQPGAFAVSQGVRPEYVVAVRGRVSLRPPGTVNPHMPTGEIEVLAEEIEVLNPAKTPPFYPGSADEVDETVRLRYRYLDLRRPEMWEVFGFRHRLLMAIREFLSARGFLEVETPMLTRSTPEGARDYLVPSRVYPGHFFALPQSPQLFKQILMVAGFERYFQFARCFRDEDLRADRQPEFTQLDMELSFIDEEQIMELVEEMIAAVFGQLLGQDLPRPFRRLSYQEAMMSYGCDKPDLRLDLRIIDITSFARSCSCQVFAGAANRGGVVRGLRVPGAGSLSRRELDELTKLATGWGARGLAWFALGTQEIRSPLAKQFTPEELYGLVDRLGGLPGDLLLFVADRPEVAETVLGQLRLDLGNRFNLAGCERFIPVWITDFPLFEYNDTDQRLEARHHPFTAPREQDLPLLETAPEQVRARAYDLVLNGTEIGGGSIRNHRRDVQDRLFRAIGLDPGETAHKFGFLLEALDYGAPPHGGIAFGIDRLVMLMLGRETIRDVIAFPKTQSSACLLTGAPAPVAPRQLEEVHINIEVRSRRSEVGS
jgi:aspartyl-tRNA synthetase